MNALVADSSQMHRHSSVSAVLGGLLAGVIISLGIGIATLVAAGLNLGVILGIDGTALAATNPMRAFVPGLLVAIAAALLFSSQRVRFGGSARSGELWPVRSLGRW